MSGVTMDDFALVAPEKQTSPEDDMSSEGRPLEAENTEVITGTKPIIHAANTDTAHHPRAPKGPQNNTRGGIRPCELPPTSTHSDQLQGPELSAPSACCGPLSPELPEYVASGRPDGPAQPWKPSPSYVPTGYIPGNLPSYRPRMSQVQFEMQRQPTRETYSTPSNHPTFERGLAHTRQHPTRQSLGPPPMEDL